MWKNLLDKFYDGLICAFSFIDIFCDVWVTLQFYNKGHTIFFWISIFILLLAQISYAVLVCLSLEPTLDPRFNGKSYKERNSESTRKYFVLFITVLPFAQLVPLYLMIANAFPKHFDKVYKWAGYKNMLNDMKKNLFYVQPDQTITFDSTAKRKPKSNYTRNYRNRRRKKRRRRFHDSHQPMSMAERKIEKSAADNSEEKDSISNESDPLSLYIRHKLMSHLGFIIEAVIEAIPQSILQMVFLIMYSSNSDSVSNINLISIFMSMIVVTSKGTILSYSIYRTTAIFNFLCFAIDIFGVFCVVSWLFCANPQRDFDGDELFEYELYGYKMWSSSYYYFIILRKILKFVCIGGLCAVCLAVHESYRFMWNHPWRKWPEIVFVSLIVSLIFFPIALICLMIRFTLLPLLVLRVFDHSQNKSFQFYNTLFTFLTNSSSISEMHEKLLITNWMLSKIAAQTAATNSIVLYGIRYNCQRIERQYCETQTMSLSFIYSKLGCPMLAKYHQIVEVLLLLFSRKGLWGFLFVKITFVLRLHSKNNKYLKFLVKSFYYFWRFIYVPLDINDISFLWNNDDGILNTKQQLKFGELEKSFYETISDIQEIINWKHFTTKVEEIIDDFLNTDFKAKWIRFKRDIALEWNAFRNQYTNNYIKSQITTGITWFFFDGLYKSIKQDILNIRNTIKGECRSQSCDWNLPRCWRSFSIMFGAKGLKESAHSKYDAYWRGYKYHSDDDKHQPWVGRGIFVFFVVVFYKCVHTPIRWFIAECPLFAFCSQFIGMLCAISIVVLLLLLAAYSVLLPIIFLLQHWYHYGLFNIEQNTLQIILTLFYFLILSAIIALFSTVWRFVYCDIHLFRFFGDKQSTPLKYADFVIKTYRAAPIRNKIIIQTFGPDIGGLILTFLPKWQILSETTESNNLKQN